MYNPLIFSLENALSFARFMYDHAIVLNSLTPFEYKDIINKYVNEQKEYGDILLQYITISNQKITKEYIESEILVTKYTKLLEKKTCALSRIEYDPNISNESTKLMPGNVKSVSPEIKKNIQNLNKKLLLMLNNSIEIYALIKKLIDEKKIFLFFDIKIIDHFIIETKSFIYTMDFFVSETDFTPTYVYCLQYNLNKFEEEHLIFLKEMLEQINPIYIEHTDSTTENIKRIMTALDNTINPKSIDELSKISLKATKDFINWDSELVASLVHKNYYSAIIEILHDHILREANYTYYLLKII